MTNRPFLYIANDIRRIEWAIAIFESLNNDILITSPELQAVEDCIAQLNDKISDLEAVYNSNIGDGSKFSDIELRED